ncbi:MAG: polysaccharide deacetylase family protein [Actinomycetota bacterium]
MSETILIISGTIILLALSAWGAVYYLTYAVRSQILGKTVWCGNGNNNSVALTFDDGPSPDTEKLLDVLRAAKVKATFFLLGENVEKYPEIARRIAAEGHEIGNHSFSHPIFLFCTASKTRSELAKTQEIIKKVTGVKPKLMRPPCGVRSRAYFAAAQELGLQTIQWSDTGFDWKKISSEQIARNILETVQSDSIILLHDGDCAKINNRLATVTAVPLILKGLEGKNLRVVPLKSLCPQSETENAARRFFKQTTNGENNL